jgi:hypothetical protein
MAATRKMPTWNAIQAKRDGSTRGDRRASRSSVALAADLLELEHPAMLQDIDQWQPVLWIVSEQLRPSARGCGWSEGAHAGYQVPRIGRHGLGNLQVHFGNTSVGRCGTASVVGVPRPRAPTFVTRHLLKRRDANEELVREDAQRPQVDVVCVRLALDHLGREVVERAAEGRPAVRRGVDGPAKVADLQVAVQAEEDVFRLDVAVDDVLRVQVVERVGHLRHVLSPGCKTARYWQGRNAHETIASR